jgi:hypothetical protein
MTASYTDTRQVPPATSVATVAFSTAATGLSDAAQLYGNTLCAIEMSTAVWTNAAITFQVSLDGTTYRDLYDTGGTEISHTTTASRTIYFDPAPFQGFNWVKLRSGTSATPVAQDPTKTVKLGLRTIASSL